MIYTKYLKQSTMHQAQKYMLHFFHHMSAALASTQVLRGIVGIKVRFKIVFDIIQFKKGFM